MSQAEFKKRLKVLMNKPENQTCADCPERQPRWASLIVPPAGSPPGSIPIGALVCLECSGSHRRLGVHISFVRSINLDSWKEKEVLAMENGGNKVVNAIFEAYPNGNKPTTLADGRTRERYIRDKYERHKFFNSVELQKFYNGEYDDSSEDESSEDEKQSVRRSSKPIKPVRAPSDAARRRAESRKARITAVSSSQSNTTSSPSTQRRVKKPSTNIATPVASKAPAKAEVQDLLDFSADFSTPMSNPGPPPDPPSLKSSPNLDLFKGMGSGASEGEPNSDVVSDNAAQSASSMGVNAPKKFNNDEILSLFNQPQQQNMQQMGFGMGGNNVMGMQNGNMNTMGMNPNMMAMQNGMRMMSQQGSNMNNMNMNNMNMNNMNMSGFNMQQQQNQQQRNMMMMMQNNGMMQQQNQFFNGTNQRSSNQVGMGNMQANMQQNIAMMNNMRLANSGMMMQGSSTNGQSNEQKQNAMGMNVMGGTSQGHNSGMRGFGM